MSWIGVAIGTAVVGTAAQSAGANSARAQQARASLQQTQQSAADFDQRNSLANDIFKENSDISQKTYEQLYGLSNDEFQQRTGLSKDTFNKLSQIEQDQVARDFASADTNVKATTDARVQRDATRDEARANYDKTLADANTVQTGFRDQGDAVAQRLLESFTPAAMGDRRTAAANTRDAVVASLVPTATAAPITQSADPAIQAAYDRYATQGRTKALTQSAAGSKVASAADALAGGDRAINSGNLDTAFISDASRRALTPLGAKLGVDSLKYNDAAGRYTDTTANADADLAAALNISGNRASGDANAVSSYGTAEDKALADYFGGRDSSVAGHGDALIGANNTKLAGTNSVSNNFENNMNNVTNFRMQSANGGLLSTLGAFASSVAPTLFSIGVGNKFGKATPAPTSSF